MRKIVLLFTLLMSVQVQAGVIAGTAIAFNPLNLTVRMALPNNTTTVGEAAMYVLEPTGYRFAVGYPASRNAAAIALAPVPPAAFNEQVVSVADALLLLIGDEHQLLIDPVHRLISFDDCRCRVRS